MNFILRPEPQDSRSAFVRRSVVVVTYKLKAFFLSYKMRLSVHKLGALQVWSLVSFRNVHIHSERPIGSRDYS